MATLVNVKSATPFGLGRAIRQPACGSLIARARCPDSGRVTMAGKQENPERPEPPEPAPVAKAETFGKALDRMGFRPLDPPRRIIVRRGRPRNPLTRWRKPDAQE